MLPWPLVLTMLGSVTAYNHIMTAQAVSAAAAAAGAAGGAAGAAVGAAVTNPRTAWSLIKLPFRALNAPFYYAGGGYAADRRLRTLEIANANVLEAQTAFVEALREKNLTFDALRVCLSEDYLGKLQTSLRAGGGVLNVANPSDPSLCTIGRFEDPFKEVYTVIVLNEVGEKILIAMVVSVAAGSALVLLIYLFRRAIRYGLRSFKMAKKVIAEEKSKENRETAETPSAPPLPSNYLTS